MKRFSLFVDYGPEGWCEQADDDSYVQILVKYHEYKKICEPDQDVRIVENLNLASKKHEQTTSR